MANTVIETIVQPRSALTDAVIYDVTVAFQHSQILSGLPLFQIATLPFGGSALALQ